jgi:hypothetical protein
MRHRAILGAALGGAVAVATVAVLASVIAKPPTVATLPRAATPPPFSMEQFRKDSRSNAYQSWTEREGNRLKTCPQCPPIDPPRFPKDEPYEDVAPPRQAAPPQRAAPRPAPMPPIKQIPEWMLKPKPAKGWDI